MTAGKSSKLKRFALFLLIGAAAAGGVAYYSGWFETPDPATGYLTAKVSTGTIEETVLATGILKPKKLVAVGAQVSGRITALDVELGQEVEEGDLIAEIDSVTQENDLKTAQASLAKTRAQLVEKQASLVLAEQTLSRQNKLAKQNATSQADLESADADVKTIEAQIDALKAEIVEAEVAVETAKANLGYTRITAPMAGTVLAIVNQAGQTVNATQSAPTIVVLGQLDIMEVRAEISEADVVKVKPGQEVSFSIIGEPDVFYTSTLESIEPAPESITSDSSITSSTSTSSSSSSTSTEAIYYNGIFHVPNPEGHLRTYMTAEVHILLGRAENVRTVPTAALKDTGQDGGYKVRVLTPTGTVEEIDVEIGLNDKVSAEVRSGLEDGDTIVIGEQSGTANSSGFRGPPGMGL
ncbi:efflux RND transporter periplasmic adaptor subunit [uncultured Roseibium sp.]|uniref:efflux RND transporter periplasmic adaptor subunit n=1 Tax=uncultured Roseibium sp. TaxID=1936171 RepID=UPI003216B3B3